MKFLERVKAYFHNAWGRTVAAAGAVIAALGTWVMSVPDELPNWLPHIVTLTSAKIGAGVVLTISSIASFLRHRKAAGMIADLKKQLDDLKAKVPPP